MSRVQPSATVHQIHFSDFGGTTFERLVFAFLLRTNNWKSIDWYGQTGSDSGRDIWGISDNDRFPNGQKICVLCANWQKLSKKKVISDLAKLIKPPKDFPNKCIVIGGGVISAELRDAIKNEASRVGIHECEVWSGPEFEERLRIKGEALPRRFVNGEVFPDSRDELQRYVDSVEADNDNERLALLSPLFDRPAFYTPFHQESSIPAFRKAITDTIEALNTGVHRLRDGTEIRRIPSRHQIQSNAIKKVLGSIEKKLAKLRSTYDSLIKAGDIRLCKCDDPECPVFESTPFAIQQMDRIRHDILNSFRKIYPKFDFHMGLD